MLPFYQFLCFYPYCYSLLNHVYPRNTQESTY